mmetsp:Transcript_46087/g.114600  ORF Transcript_46087/g.114600 Transcript_46087/m.114600 type:complete len:164 (+) Transcript_46087:289-780(+)
MTRLAYLSACEGAFSVAAAAGWIKDLTDCYFSPSARVRASVRGRKQRATRSQDRQTLLDERADSQSLAPLSLDGETRDKCWRLGVCCIVLCIVCMWQRRDEARQGKAGTERQAWYGTAWYGMARHSPFTEWMDDIGRQRQAGRGMAGRSLFILLLSGQALLLL